MDKVNKFDWCVRTISCEEIDGIVTSTIELANEFTRQGHQVLIIAPKSQGVPDMQVAFAAMFGQGQWTIAGSIAAFLIGQLIDVAIYHRVRRATGGTTMWSAVAL